MFFPQLVCVILPFLSHALAMGYGSGGGHGGHGSFGGLGGYGGGFGGNSDYGKSVPKPYAFGYQAPDNSGNGHFRKEQGDGNGNVQGSYGYTDHQGLHRQVDYMADQSGFRAKVKTNEPGTDGKENPADVSMNVQHPPAGVQEKYTRSSGFGGYGSGSHGGGFGQGSGSGLFHGIPRSSTGKSGY